MERQHRSEWRFPTRGEREREREREREVEVEGASMDDEQGGTGKHGEE